ncbi:MAG: thiamine-phosphate kinase [Candidatus Omnitrophica bacterium]|nr:thiamine-phosphate kinase [Candidatus Omnitrophota bacterium]
MKIKDIGEIGLIKRIAKGVKLDRSVVEGIGDDTAVLKWTKDKYLLFTCDMLIEDVHFKLNKAKPYQIGWKALGRNISDIAAMGGMPRHAVISIGLNPKYPASLLDGIYKGISALGRKFGVNIVGGDTCRSEKLVIDISLIGEVEKKNLLTRRGAKVGDVIFLTGSIGGSIKGKHLNFVPRLDESRKLTRNFRINSMIDISDGLELDLWRILESSRVGARIYQNMIPLSASADSFRDALREGEDFELLFTMDVKEAKRFLISERVRIKAPVTLIGEVMDRKYGYKLITTDGKIENLKAKGYLHF